LKIDKQIGYTSWAKANQLGNIGLIYRANGELEEARKCFELVLRIFQKFRGTDHPSTRNVRGYLNSLTAEKESG
jgi:tetratricopeptide (TPR) repeat protein